MTKHAAKPSQHNRWSQGPAFFLPTSDFWPANPCLSATAEPVEELRKSMFCGTVMSGETNSPDQIRNSSWEDLMKETATLLDGGGNHSPNTAQDFINAKGIFYIGPNRRISQRSSIPLKIISLYLRAANCSHCLLNMTITLISSEWEVGSGEQRTLNATISIQSYWTRNMQ